MTEVQATVAICTRNRARTLTRALTALCEQRGVAAATWEVLVVDNASTDSTQQVIDAFRNRLPIRTHIESSLGLSNARNRAVAEARGDYLLWIDDDAVPDTDWLSSYLAAFDRWPDAVVLGGPSDVAFDAPLPGWFTRILPRVKSIYAHRDLGDEHIALTPREEMLPYGTNYVTRAAEQRRFPYNTLLGRHPAHPHRGSEETDVMLGMLNAGCPGRWVPGARVTHLLGIERANTAFIAEHSTAYGKYRAEHFPYPGARIAGAPAPVWWRAVRYVARYAYSRRFSAPEVWIEDLIQRSEAIGNLQGLRSRRQEPHFRSGAAPP